MVWKYFVWQNVGFWASNLLDYTRRYFSENKFPPTSPDYVTKMRVSAP